MKYYEVIPIPPQAPFLGADLANMDSSTKMDDDFSNAGGYDPNNLTVAQKNELANRGFNPNDLTPAEKAELIKHYGKTAGGAAAGEGKVSTAQLTDEQKQQIAAAGAAAAAMIANRKQNEFKKALKNHCGRKPLLKKGKHRPKWDAWQKCANEFAKQYQASRNMDSGMISKATDEVINEPDEANTILGMPQGVAIGVFVILGALAAWAAYKKFAKK